MGIEHKSAEIKVKKKRNRPEVSQQKLKAGITKCKHYIFKYAILSLG